MINLFHHENKDESSEITKPMWKDLRVEQYPKNSAQKISNHDS